MILKQLFGKKYTDDYLATYRDADGWFYDWMTEGQRTASGETVTPHTALTLSGYFAGIRAISEDVGKLPLILYKRLKPRGKERATENRLYSILHDQPNPLQTAMKFRQDLTAHAIGWGNGYAEIERLASGEVLYLWPLDPSRMTVDLLEDGSIVYELTLDKGGIRRLASDDVFHIPGFGFNGLTGYSLANMAKQSIGLGLATEKFGAALFGNGSNPRGLFTHPGKPKPEARKQLLDGIRREHVGAENAMKDMLLWEGITYQQITIPPNDAQFIESRQLTIEECARWLRVPPHKIMHLLRSTFSNIEHQAIEYVTDSLMPWFVRWEQEIHRKLITWRRKNELFAEHLVAGLLRGDLASQNAAYATAVQNGWMSRNDVREKQNENPIPGGDKYTVQSQMILLEDVGKKPDPLPPPMPEGEDEEEETDDQTQAAVKLILAEQIKRMKADGQDGDLVIARITGACRPLLTDLYRKILHAETGKLSRNAKRDDFSKWLEEFYKEHAEYVRCAMGPVVDSVCGSIWAVLGEGNMPLALEEAIGSQTQEMVNRHILYSQDSLLQQNDIEPVLEKWNNGRVEQCVEKELCKLGALMFLYCVKDEQHQPAQS